MKKIVGIVKSGKGRGTQFGFPTVNIFCNNKDLVGGTWRFNVKIKNQQFNIRNEASLMNKEGKEENYNHNIVDTFNTSFIYQAIGPYFPEQNLLEIHLLNFQGDLYFQELEIYPLQKIRENKQFLDTNALVAQIEKDKEWVQSHLIKVITFGTFDILHPGHISYLKQAKYWGDELIVIVARDNTVQNIKKHIPKQNEQFRLKIIKSLDIVDYAFLGDNKNYYKVFDIYHPQVVCLGYDQHSFEEGIGLYCKEHSLYMPHVIRLNPYYPEKFKTSLM